MKAGSPASIFLGIKTGISHSNACLLDLEKKTAEIRIEERLSRRKYQGGYPSLSLKSLLEFNKELIRVNPGHVATNSCTHHPKKFENKISKYSQLLPQTSVLENK